jgi:hypothetical protein
LRIDLIENRFEYLSGKALLKEEKVLQHYRHIPMKADANQMLTGLGTGQGTWGTSNLLLTKLTAPLPHRCNRGLFAGLFATMEGSDFSCSFFIGFDSSSSRRGPLHHS